MRIDVRYFAVVRERLRTDGEPLELPDGATVRDALDRLSERHPAIAGLRGHLAAAVNQEMVPPAHPLADGDELALIPPVAGGAGTFRVVDRPVSLDEVTSAVGGDDCGAVVTFTGVVRRHSRGAVVARLEYEAYVEMAERCLARIGADVMAAHPGSRVAIVHRVGALASGETSVVIAAASPHRAEAFDACRAVIERLKTDVPIWKKELAADGTAIWVGIGS